MGLFIKLIFSALEHHGFTFSRSLSLVHTPETPPQVQVLDSHSGFTFWTHILGSHSRFTCTVLTSSLHDEHSALCRSTQFLTFDLQGLSRSFLLCIHAHTPARFDSRSCARDRDLRRLHVLCTQNRSPYPTWRYQKPRCMCTSA